MPSRDDPLRRVILLRHGRTSWNAQSRWQGHRDVPLDATGLRQAQAAAQLLVQDTTIASVTTSDLARAAQTASVVHGAFDLAGRPARRSVDARWREIDMGQWSGLTHDEVNGRYPEESAALARGEDLRRGLDGETMAEAVLRARAAFQETASMSQAGTTTLVVAHGAVIRGLVGDLVGLPMVEMRRLFGSLRNCHWVVMVGRDDVWRIEQWNVGSVA